MTLSAFAVGALACVVAFLALCPFIPEISAGVRAIVALRAVRNAVTLFGHGFLGVTRAIDWARAVITAWRKSAGRPICAIALAAALGAAAIVGAVSAAYAGPLARDPGDVVYLPSLAVRADGRLALADGVTLAEAARVYAGPAEAWGSSCRATLPGFYMPIDWQGLDAVRQPLWRASISGTGVVTVNGLGPAEADPLRALLAELAPIVACRK
jgi:hypothetical protein